MPTRATMESRTCVHSPAGLSLARTRSVSPSSPAHPLSSARVTKDDDAPVARSMSAQTVDVGSSDPSPVAPTTPSPFDRTADRFESRGEIGRGGMGRVEDAFDRALGRPVAIKHLLRGSDVDRARFEREARITARLEHPGIVPVHDAGRSADGTPYYVMRHVDGRPLSERVTAAVSLADRLALIPNVLAACDAIAFAHARGIVHRDLKPTNILVGPFGETLVIDWGLAREIDPDAAASGTEIPVSEPQLTVAGRSREPPASWPPSRRAASRSTRAPTSTRSARRCSTSSPASRRTTARARPRCSIARARAGRRAGPPCPTACPPTCARSSTRRSRPTRPRATGTPPRSPPICGGS